MHQPQPVEGSKHHRDKSGKKRAQSVTPVASSPTPGGPPPPQVLSPRRLTEIEECKKKRTAAEAHVTMTILLLSEMPSNPSPVHPALLEADAFLLAYKRYLKRRYMAKKIFDTIEECAQKTKTGRHETSLTDVINKYAASLRLLALWMRSRIDTGYIELHKRLPAVLSTAIKSHFDTIREEASRVMCSLIWALTSTSLRAAASPRPETAIVSAESLRLWAYTHDLIAEALTKVHFEKFCEIPLADFNDKAWSKPGCDSLLYQFIERSNRISNWVISNILIQETAKTQFKVWSRFVWIAHQLHHTYGNFDAAMAVMNGVGKQWVTRLHKQWDIKKDFTYLYLGLMTLYSGTNNYKRGREAIQKRLEKKEPLIPHIAIILRDLTFIEDANPNLLEDKRPNTKKIGLLRDTFSIIQRAKNSFREKSAAGVTPGLQKLVLTLPSKSEQWLEDRSDKIRPRASNATNDTDSGITLSTATDSSEGASALDVSSQRTAFDEGADGQSHSSSSSPDEALLELSVPMSSVA